MGLDHLSNVYNDEILPLLMPVVEARLADGDWRKRESAILALGAVRCGSRRGAAGPGAPAACGVWGPGTWEPSPRAGAGPGPTKRAHSQAPPPPLCWRRRPARRDSCRPFPPPAPRRPAPARAATWAWPPTCPRSCPCSSQSWKTRARWSASSHAGRSEGEAGGGAAAWGAHAQRASGGRGAEAAPLQAAPCTGSISSLRGARRPHCLAHPLPGVRLTLLAPRNTWHAPALPPAPCPPPTRYTQWVLMPPDAPAPPPGARGPPPLAPANEALFDAALAGVLRRVGDHNRTVQQSACSALATMEEHAGGPMGEGVAEGSVPAAGRPLPVAALVEAAI
jgi:hypothetical protein